MENNKELVELAHIIANQNPQLCVADVNDFTANKSIITKSYNTTVLLVGVDRLGQAQTQIITTCLITWLGTQEEKKALDNVAKIMKA